MRWIFAFSLGLTEKVGEGRVGRGEGVSRADIRGKELLAEEAARTKVLGWEHGCRGRGKPV